MLVYPMLGSPGTERILTAVPCIHLEWQPPHIRKENS